jgi:hypothetical protein
MSCHRPARRQGDPHQLFAAIAVRKEIPALQQQSAARKDRQANGP